MERPLLNQIVELWGVPYHSCHGPLCRVMCNLGAGAICRILWRIVAVLMWPSTIRRLNCGVNLGKLDWWSFRNVSWFHKLVFGVIIWLLSNVADHNVICHVCMLLNFIAGTASVTFSTEFGAWMSFWWCFPSRGSVSYISPRMKYTNCGEGLKYTLWWRP